LLRDFLRLLRHRSSNRCVRWVNRDLAIGYPIDDADWQAVRARGVRGVIDVSASCGDLGSIVRHFGMRYLRLPVAPDGLPEAGELHIVTSWLLQRVCEDGPVLIHDTSIRGNDALVACAGLIKRGASVRRATLQVHRAATSPLTDAQLDLLEQFAGQTAALPRA
jgi:hypothetical protein